MQHRKRRSHRRRRSYRRRRNPVARRRRPWNKGKKLRNLGWVRRHQRHVNPIGRRRRRRGRRRNPVNFRGFQANFRDLISRDTLTVAGGAVLGGLATSWVMSQWGPVKLVNGVPVAKGAGEFKLPGSDTQFGPLIYSVAIPLLGAAVVPMVFRGTAGRDLAKGMIIGSAVLLIQNVVNLVQGFARPMLAPTAGTDAYVQGRRIRTLGAPQSAIAPVRANPLAQRSAFRGFGAHAN